ncbi:MAG: UbiA family prenyltransferase [Lacipirellulaceae bacterium]
MKTFVAVAKLLRLSNAPTAVADVWMGCAVATGALAPSWGLALLTASSLCLYHGGMALNDWADAERDAIDRRGRPIAEGAVSRRAAAWLAACLLGLGVCSAGFVSWLAPGSAPGWVAIALLCAIAAYNSPLKHTLVGPPLMGCCRALNGVLGMAIVPLDPAAVAAVAPGVLLYVAGLTLFARDEARVPRRPRLVLGLVISLLGLYTLSALPWERVAELARLHPGAWFRGWAIAALLAVRGMVAGVSRPTRRNVGRGVGIGIQGLVVIDALLGCLYAGPVAGLAILALLPLTIGLARVVPQT